MVRRIRRGRSGRAHSSQSRAAGQSARNLQTPPRAVRISSFFVPECGVGSVFQQGKVGKRDLPCSRRPSSRPRAPMPCTCVARRLVIESTVCRDGDGEKVMESLNYREWVALQTQDMNLQRHHRPRTTCSGKNAGCHASLDCVKCVPTRLLANMRH